MFTFRMENDFEKFDSFVRDHKGSYLQCSLWPEVKTAWKPYFYSGFDGDTQVLTALVLERKLPAVGKLWYLSCGPVCADGYAESRDFMAAFSDFLKAEMKRCGAFCVITDPLIPLRIDGDEQPQGIAAHKLLTGIGYELNPDIASYTYKHPVQTMIPLKDENGDMIPAEKILKGCEKGVRYSVRVGASRGLVAKRYTYDDIAADSKILDSFMEVMGDTSDRNSFLNRDADYCLNLVKTLRDYTDITIVYYDKAIDAKLEAERQARKEEVLQLIPTAPQKKIRGLQDEVDVINKNTQSFNQRMEETSEYAEDAKIAVAAGLTIRYGGVASCVFGGTRNIVRNNTRSSHYLNYLRMCESVEQGMDYHDLGYVLVKNPEILPNGTLGTLEPVENFIGICDFKKSFGAKYFEFIGEYVLVGNKFKYWMYKELMPKAKKVRNGIVKKIRKKAD